MERWHAPTTVTRHERIEFHNHNTLPTRRFQTKPPTLHRTVSFQVSGPFSTATFFPGVPRLNIQPHLFDRRDTHLVGRSNFMDSGAIWLLLSPPSSGSHRPLLPPANLGRADPPIALALDPQPPTRPPPPLHMHGRIHRARPPSPTNNGAMARTNHGDEA